MNKKIATFRFYAELNDFLPKDKQKVAFNYIFSGRPTVKDAIEACGVPHPEVEIILVDDKSVDFAYHINDGERIAVYPEFESVDISPLLKLHQQPRRETKFILDTHLGKLARNLRMFGFDVLYAHEFSDQEIITCSLEEKRIILTRDQGLLKNKEVTHGLWIRCTESENQTTEVIKRLDLLSQIKPLTRCLVCNTLLESVEKSKIIDKLPPNTKKYYSEYKICLKCENVYWSGSHYQRMQKKIEKIKKSVQGEK